MSTQSIEDPLVKLALAIGSALRKEMVLARLEISTTDISVSVTTDQGRLFATYKGVPPMMSCKVHVNGVYVDEFFGHKDMPR